MNVVDNLATNFADVAAAHYLATAGLITAAAPGSSENVEAMRVGPFILARAGFRNGTIPTTGYALHVYRRTLATPAAKVASTLTIEEV